MNQKLPYEYVALHVDRLYEKKFEDHEDDAIHKHCEFIAEFIRSCGWDEDSFIRAMFGFAPLDSQLN
jgi:hypothetical protein